MTLRITAEIVPFGDEEYKRTIGVLNISNLGEVENLGFGHAICRYKVVETDPEAEDSYPWPHVGRHDRRDGFWSLLFKALKLKLEQDQ